MTWRRFLTASFAAVALLLCWNHVAALGGALAREPETAQYQPKYFGRSVGFADERRLDQHYEKHGHEFGRITKQDYLRQAQLLRDTKVEGPVLEAVRSDGVTTRFDRETGAFVAFNTRTGVIRTYFKPNDGERYFRRQADRD